MKWIWLCYFAVIWSDIECVGSEISINVTDGGINYISLINFGAYPLNEQHLTFKVKGAKDAHIRLYSLPIAEASSYQYILRIAAWNNTRSLIQLIKEGNVYEVFAQYDEVGLMNSNEYREFWISWDDGNIQAGTGNCVSQSVFMQWKDPCPFAVNDIVISTMWGETVEWIFQSPSLSGIAHDQIPTNVTFQRSTNCPTFQDIKETMGFSHTECSLMCVMDGRCRGFIFLNSTQTCRIQSDIAINNTASTVYRMIH